MFSGSSEEPKIPRKVARRSFVTADVGERKSREDAAADAVEHSEKIFKEFHAYCGGVKERAEALVKILPDRVKTLDELLKDPKFDLGRLGDIQGELDIPVPDVSLVPAAGAQATSSSNGQQLLETNDLAMNIADVDAEDNKEVCRQSDRRVGRVCGNSGFSGKISVLPNARLPSNVHIKELTKVVKPYLRQLMADADLLVSWIQLNTPKIEDGNNFGVEVQENVAGEVDVYSQGARKYYDHLLEYFKNRAAILAEAIKFPQIEDYVELARELDEAHFVQIRRIVLKARDFYAQMLDVVSKNIDKIREPRAGHLDAMY